MSGGHRGRGLERPVGGFHNVDRTGVAEVNVAYLDSVRLSEVTDPGCTPYLGRTLAEWNRGRGDHPSDALADLVARNDLRPGLTYTIGFFPSGWDEDPTKRNQKVLACSLTFTQGKTG